MLFPGTNFAAIDILKLTGNQLNEKNFSIFNPVTSEMGFFNISIQDAKSRDKRYCVGLVQLVEDVFTEEVTPTYHIEVIDVSPSASPNGIVYSTALDDDSIQITLKRNSENENGCLIRQSGSIDWNRDFCTTRSFSPFFTSCQCLRLGFIRLGKVVIPTTTSTTTLPAIIATIVNPTSAAVGNSNNQKLPTRTTTKKPNNGIQSDAMMTSNNQDNFSEANFASTWYYIIPVMFVLFVVAIVGFLVMNEKRRSYEKRLKAVAQILVGILYNILRTFKYVLKATEGFLMIKLLNYVCDKRWVDLVNFRNEICRNFFFKNSITNILKAYVLKNSSVSFVEDNS